MSDTVRVQTNEESPWWTRWYENFYAGTPGGRAQEVMRPGSVRNTPVGRAEPERYGISALGGGLTGIGRGIEEQTLNIADALGRFFRSEPQAAPGQGLGSRAYSQTGGEVPDFGGRERTAGRLGGRGERMERSESYRQAQADLEPAADTFESWLAANMGTFDESPYRNYMDFLASQDEETMARINAMYAQLAGEAENNLQRIQDIYGSAQRTSGDVFGQSAQSIEDAYASASQQAADQMARLGIEAAAPATLTPMALSQAEALSGIERAGAGALDALNRYGTTAQDFGSQMAQVGQQQGLEVSNQILRDMAQRQAEAAFQMEQARGSFNPYAQALQRMEMEQAYNRPMLEADAQAREQALEAAQSFTRSQSELQELRLRSIIDLMGEGYDYNEAAVIVDNTLGIGAAQ